MAGRTAPWQPDQGAAVAARTAGAPALVALAVIHVVDLPRRAAGAVASAIVSFVAAETAALPEEPLPERQVSSAMSKRRPGSPRTMSPARPRIAAARAAQQRARMRRRLLVAVASITAVIAVVVALVAVKLTSPTPVASESPAPPGLARQATTVPAAVLSQVKAGEAATPLQATRRSGAPLTIGGKPAIVFVSEESCPFCAAERWPLVVALSHFGTWSHLGSTRSSATDIYPGTATLSFRDARYTSRVLTLRTTELTDNRGRPCRA